jgi:hypothetical protein
MGRSRGEHEDARVDGKKQGGLVCVALCALPPADVAWGTGATPAMNAAEKALLRFVRELRDDGTRGRCRWARLWTCALRLCLWAHSEQRGVFDSSGGFEFQEKRVEAEPLPWPPLSGAKLEEK